MMILSTVAWVSVVVVALVCLQGLYGTWQTMNKVISAAQRGATNEIRALEREAEIAAQNQAFLGWRERLACLSIVIGITNEIVNGTWLPLISIGLIIVVVFICMVIIVKLANMRV